MTAVLHTNNLTERRGVTIMYYIQFYHLQSEAQYVYEAQYVSD